MVNLKKYNEFLKLFVIFLTLTFIVSCNTQSYYVAKIEGKRIPITEKQNQVVQIDNFIKPYREQKHLPTKDSVITPQLTKDIILKMILSGGKNLPGKEELFH